MHALRRWTPLLVLAAVFALHGLDCVGVHPAHADTGSSVVVAHGSHPSAVPSVPDETELPVSGADVLALCLAVVTAGIALILSRLRRRVAGARSAGARDRQRPPPRAGPLLVPPFSRLCVLRI